MTHSNEELLAAYARIEALTDALAEANEMLLIQATALAKYDWNPQAQDVPKSVN